MADHFIEICGAYLEISALGAYPSLEGNNAFLGLSLTAFHCP
jgi:hypothetical protein